MDPWYRIAKEIIKTIARYNARGIDLSEVYYHIDVESRKVQISTEPCEPPYGDTLGAFDPAGLMTDYDVESIFVQDFVAECLLDSEIPLGEDLTEEDLKAFDVLDEELEDMEEDDDDILGFGGKFE